MPTRPKRYSANRVFALLAAAFTLLFALVVIFLAVDQKRVLESSARLQTKTVPEIIRYQRLARNLDLLRQEGEQVFSSDTPDRKSVV